MKIFFKLKKSAAEELFVLAEILTKLRYHTKHWEEHYGFEAKENKKAWEKTADKWIDEHLKSEE